MRKYIMVLLAVAALCSLSMADGTPYPAGNLLKNTLAPGNVAVQPGIGTLSASDLANQAKYRPKRTDDCNIICSPGAISDGESGPPCLSGLNEGCNSTPMTDTPIECNTSVCGTIFTYVSSDGVPTRDTDFFHLVLTQQTRVTWIVTAGFPAAAIIASVNSDCNLVVVFDSQSGNACETITASACLQAGEYWLFVSTNQIYDGIPCTAYAARVVCSPCDNTCVGTEYVAFQPGTPPPQFQCVTLCLDHLLPIYVCGGGTALPPSVVVRSGCFQQRPGCDIECPPATYSYDPTAWTFDPATGCWVNFVRPLTEGCACVGFDGFLPVELLSFSATSGSDRVSLAWQTASETDNDHFEITRDNVKIAQIAANRSASGSHYAYADQSVEHGRTYAYDLVAVDVNGTRAVLASESATLLDQPTVVSEYALYQNYPNPFNPTTQIRFDLSEAGFVTLKVFNPMGQEVATLVNGNLGAGAKTVSFDASSLPSGVYLYRLAAGNFTAVKKMILMK